MGPGELLNDLVAKAILRDPLSFMSKTGSISIVVPGRGGCTLNFGDVDDPIVEGFRGTADLRLRFMPSAFDAFVSGDMDIQSAIDKRHLQVAGDLDLLEKLAHLMADPSQGGGGMVSARAAFSKKKRRRRG